jgi:RNA polymerase sigma factor (sigma-70 family)
MTALSIPFPLLSGDQPAAGLGRTSSCTLRGVQLEPLSDEQLVETARAEPARASECLGVLYGRYHSKVAYWCLRVCGSREEAADLAQEVFLRVHSRLGSFRGESRFSTWLYQVTRSVAINRGESSRRHSAPLADLDSTPEMADPLPDAEELLDRAQAAGELRAAMEELEPLEARVLYLHFADGLTLPRITDLLRLENRSGAKAYIVSAMRKLRRRFGVGKEVNP